jgi:hypothetical protein
MSVTAWLRASYITILAIGLILVGAIAGAYIYEWLHVMDRLSKALGG